MPSPMTPKKPFGSAQPRGRGAPIDTSPTPPKNKGPSVAEKEMVEQAAAYEAERAIGRAPLQQIAGTTVPGVTAAALDPRFRDQQIQLMDVLRAQAEGRGPSLAQMQFKEAGNTALQKAMGAIRAGTGSNPALAGRTAALASTNLLGNLASQSGMARLKEQQDAQTSLASILAAGRTGDLQARQQDIGLGTSNAEIALRNMAAQQAAAEGLLANTGQRYEGYYNRGAQVQATKRAGSGSPDLLSALLPAAIGAGTTILTANPAAGAGAAAATGASVSPASGIALTGGATPPAAEKKPVSSGPKMQSGPFGKFRR